MKKLSLSFVMMLMGIGMANAQSVYTYVQQDGTVVEADGAAKFDVTANPTIEFDSNGKAVMTIGDNKVAELPMSDGGQLIVEFENNSGLTAGTLPVNVTDAGYATLYSPFQLAVPASSDIEVYAPTYDKDSYTIHLNSTTQIGENAIIPVGTGLVLKNAGTITFGISGDAATDTHTSALSGSALVISKPTVDEGNTVFTLGKNGDDVGFYSYDGTTMAAAKGYLVAAEVPSGAKYINFNIDDEATAISQISAVNSQLNDGKFVENGRVVIKKNGQKYNTAGQLVK